MNGNHLRWRVLRWRAVLALILLFVWAIPSVSAQNSPRYFAPTGHYVRGAFRSFWERNGGLPIFGYPLTEEYIRRSDQRIIQFFERARFELTVRNNQAIVELAWLGSEYTVSQSFPRTPPVPSSGSIRYFPDTGHTLRGAFLTFWNRRGAERIFGQPISEEFQEQLTDGRWHTVQYFQRSRFELWGDVRLGLLGRALAPPQQLAPWPPNSPPAGPLNEDGTPRPPTQQPPPAGAAAVRVEPNSGRAGQTFTVQGEGFDRDERVSLWLTVPGGSVRPIAQKPTADGNGSISGARIQIPTDSGFRDGVWYVTAQGLASGRQAIGSFRIAGTAAPGPAPAPPPPNSPLGNMIHDSLRPSGNGSIVPLAAPSGFVFTFTAAGFDPNERIGAWLTRPDGKAEGLDGRLIAPDGRGGARVTFGTQRLAEGVWTITAQGTATGRMVTAPFKLTRDYVAPLGTPRPASRNGAVTPAEGGVRSPFQLTGTGFRASETLELWITAPDGIYYLAGTARADARGRIGYAPTQIVQLTAGSPTGVYGYHYRGTRSGVRVDLYFTFTG